jgi:hypothetical protein
MGGRIEPVKAAAVGRIDAGLLRVWLVQLPSWFGWAGSLVVVGWLVFAATASPAAVSLAYAARLAPLVLVAVPAGAIVDRLGATRALVTANFAGAAVAVVLAALALGGAPVGTIVLAGAALGATDAVRMVTGPALTYELSVTLAPTRTIALTNLSAGIGQALGAGVVGVVLAAAGAPAAAFLVGVGYASAGWLASGLRAGRRVVTASGALRADLAVAIDLLRDVPAVTLLIGVAIGVELFGFAGIALDPVFAGSVFGGGAAALGTIGASRSIGRLAGSLGVAAAWRGHALVPSIGLTSGLFGLALVAYAAAPGIGAAIPFVALAGLAGGVIDILEQGGLQDAVPERVRARATALWVLTVGLGPIGVLLAGIVAESVGPRAAQGAFGVVVAGIGLVVVAAAATRRWRSTR